MFDFNKWQRETAPHPLFCGEFFIKNGHRLLPRIRCVSGLELSVQASATHYCEPRKAYAESYTSVEVGFPSVYVPALMRYAENPKDPTGTVYARVPVSVINAIVEDNGGIAEIIYQS